VTTESNPHEPGGIGEALALHRQGRQPEAALLLRQLHQVAPQDLVVRRMLGAIELVSRRLWPPGRRTAKRRHC
jgi:hypothetical protein